MKKLFLIIAVLVFAAGIAGAQNKLIIAGYVTNDSTGAPINNHMVYIMTDSSQTNFPYYNSLVTDTNGFYYDSIPIPSGQVIPFNVSTYDCNQQLHLQTVYSGNGSTLAVVNFAICDGNAPPLCNAYYISSNDSNYYANLVYFFDYSTPVGQITSWVWCFSDPLSGINNYSPLQNPTHYFVGFGTYNVCLTITTSFGCSSTYCHTIIITGTSSGCQAAFTIVPDSLPNSLTYHFYDQSTGNPSNWYWNFGDGTTSALQNPVHSYNAYGIYLVSLIIIGDSCQSMAIDTLVINENPANCDNYFTHTEDNLTVTLNGYCTSPYPTNYTWSVFFTGGPFILTGQNATYTFPTDGTYLVELLTVDSTGCTDSTQQYIQVSSNQWSSIWGHLLIQNTFADHGLIQLLAVDSLNNFTPYDSTYISDSIGFYYFSNVQPGNYVILASLTENSVYYGQYAPTYYVDAIMWSDATIVQPGSSDPRDIQMVQFLNYTPGNGTISGIINQNLKVSGSGIPAPNIEVLLLDQNNQALASTVTNTSGFFEFSTLAMGTYTVYPEVAGKTTIPAHITLDAANPSSTVNFTMNQGNVIFGIRDNFPSGLSGISEIYPNPPDGILNLDVIAQKDCSVNAAIFNTTGQMMQGARIQLQKGSNHVVLYVSGLSKGVYSLNIFSDNGGSASKKFVVVK